LNTKAVAAFFKGQEGLNTKKYNPVRAANTLAKIWTANHANISQVTHLLRNAKTV
jgi:hypothetical protein